MWRLPPLQIQLGGTSTTESSAVNGEEQSSQPTKLVCMPSGIRHTDKQRTIEHELANGCHVPEVTVPCSLPVPIVSTTDVKVTRGKYRCYRYTILDNIIFSIVLYIVLIVCYFFPLHLTSVTFHRYRLKQWHQTKHHVGPLNTAGSW